MNRQRKLLIGVCGLLWVLPVATIACPPDCPPCYYWSGNDCEPYGQCQSVWGCGGCMRCVNCWCEPQDYYCHYWYDDCWYCDSGECVNSCGSCEVCVDGECVCAEVTSISGVSGTYCIGDSATVTANGDFPEGCPITWSGPGYFSDFQGNSARITFTSTGTNLRITASTSCQQSPTWSPSFNVVTLVSVSASKTSPALCEDVTFTAITDPSGHGGGVQWSAPEGEPSSGGPSATFITHWPCIGGKTVTATLGGCSKSANINVVLPEGCTTGSTSAGLEGSVLSTEVSCPQGPCGKTALLSFPVPSVTAVYNGCAWAFQVTANAYLESGVCSGNFIDTGGEQDVSPSTYCGVVYRFVVRNGCYPNADGTINSNSTCVLAHEAKHVEIFQTEFADRSSWLASQPSMSDMAIDCSNPSTVSCQAAASARQAAITSDVRQACLDAWAAQNETLPEAAAQVCFWGVANDLCSYAYGHGWPGCPYCPE